MENNLSIKNERFQYIDLLRFIFAVFVMFFHYFFLSNYSYGVSNTSPSFLNNIFIYGKLGVNLFFIISGFVIIYTVKNKGAFDFLISRISRLLPGIMIVSVIGYLSFLLLPSPSQLQSVNFIYFLQNFFGLTIIPFINNIISGLFIDGSMWSLRYELGFYFLVLLLILTKQLKYLSFYVWGWVSLSIIKVILPFSFLHNVPDQLIGSKFASFFSIGILVYILKSKIDLKYKIYNVLFLTITTFFSLYNIFIYTDVGNKVLALLFYVMGLVFFLLAVFFNPKYSKIYEILGGSSYVLYLIHQNFGYRIMLYFGNWYWYKSVVLGFFMILLAILIHILLEKKLIYLIKRTLNQFRLSLNIK